jgi:hypothetical protein
MVMMRMTSCKNQCLAAAERRNSSININMLRTGAQRNAENRRTRISWKSLVAMALLEFTAVQSDDSLANEIPHKCSLENILSLPEHVPVDIVTSSQIGGQCVE